MNEWTDSDAGESFEIAIVGMAGRFPGADDLASFWRNLRDGVESIARFSAGDLLALGVDPALLARPDFVRAAPVLNGIDLFDAAFFGYTPREAVLIDPQQRLFLECAWAALESAGYPTQPPGCMTAVYAGTGLSTYLLFNLLGNPALDQGDETFSVMIGNDKDFLSTRVSYKLNLKGPSVNVQTGCSTSLVAVHMACQSLLAHECDLALAGGVAVQVPQHTGYLYQEGDTRSPDGHCRAFDAQARGTVFGSGVGVMALKRLDDALRDGDTIHALIKSTAMNNDGAAKLGYTAPSVEGQAEVIARAHTLAGISARSIGYVEAHGTGTVLGDPAEVLALTRAFRATTGASQFCALGSVKTNIGHLDTAAGIAGLIKAVLALQHAQIPPSLHFTSPNPQIDFAATPFFVSSRLVDWPKGDKPRRAGVSSFGIGGTNVHMVLEEAPARVTDPARDWQLLLLSAKTPAALADATGALAGYLHENATCNLADVAYTLAVGRQPMPQRRALVCRDHTDALERLSDIDHSSPATRVQASGSPPVAFLFPGQGSQYPGMARDLYEAEPVFREHVDRCAALLRPHLGLDLRTVLFAHHRPPTAENREPRTENREPRTENREPRTAPIIPNPGLSQVEGSQLFSLDQTWLAQPALFALEYALAQLWQSWGVRPHTLIGHSVGEWVAACLAGVFSLEDALALVAARGRLMQQCTPGAMLAVPLAEQDVLPLLGPGLSLAAVNGPRHCTVAGPEPAIEELVAQFERQDVLPRRLPVGHAFHSAMMDSVLEPFTRLVGQVRRAPPQMPYLSNVSGTWITAEQATDPEYWAAHLRQTVRFGDGIATLLEDPDIVLLEVGPTHILSTLARQQAVPATARTIVASLRHPQESQPDRAALLAALGRLWAAGVAIDWSAVYAQERRGRVALPTYPFERQRYWIAPGTPAQARRPTPGKRPDLGAWFATPSWKRVVLPAIPADRAGEPEGCWLVFLDPHGIGAALAERLAHAGCAVTQVALGDQFERCDDGCYMLDPQQPGAYVALLRDLAERGALPRGILHLWSLAPPRCEQDGPACFRQAQRYGFYSLLFLAQALARAQGDQPCRLWVVSSHLHAVESQDAPYAEHAPLQAIGTVVPQECEALSCHLIDVAWPPAPGVDLIAQLMDELARATPAPVVAYRGPQRWLPIFEPLRLEGDAVPARRLRDGGVYLIVGGLGSVGMLLAEELARAVPTRLVLVARSAFPPRDAWELWLSMYPGENSVSAQIRRLQALEQHGAEVLVCSADAADEAAMRGVVERARVRFGAIHGVIHAAGLSGEQALTRLAEVDPAACERQFRAKVDGLYVLERVLRGIPIDFCLLCSSNSSVLGGLGALAYAAAHHFMDSFALRRAAAGEPWISANWDGWLLPDRTGLGAGLQTSLDRYAMTPTESAAAFQRMLASAPAGQVVVSTGDLEQRRAVWIGRAPVAGAQALQPRPTLGTSYTAPASALEQAIVAVWQEVLGIERLGIHDNFFDLGGTSLTAIRVVGRLERELQISIPVIQLFEGPTVSALARVLGAQSSPISISGQQRGEQRRARYQL